MKRLLMRILLVAGVATSLLTLSAVSIDDWDSTDWATKVTQFNSTPVANVSTVNGVTAAGEDPGCTGSTVLLTPAITSNAALGAAGECEAARFVVPSGKSWCVKQLQMDACGGVNEPDGPIKIRVWNDDSNKPGTVLIDIDITTEVGAAAAYPTRTAITKDVSPGYVLAAGTYWVGQSNTTIALSFYLGYQNPLEQTQGYATASSGPNCGAWTVTNPATIAYDCNVLGVEFTP